MSNILVIAWDKQGKILKATAFRDENAADAKARNYLEDEDTAHVVKYHTTFKPEGQPKTTLDPYDWFDQTE